MMSAHSLGATTAQDTALEPSQGYSPTQDTVLCIGWKVASDCRKILLARQHVILTGDREREVRYVVLAAARGYKP
jgi:hypothetical protein